MQDDVDLGPQLREIVFLANGAGITVNGVSRHDLDRQSATRKHQGVIALVRDTRYVQIEDLVFAADGLKEPPLLVVLDGVQDPHNLGAIARTVDAAGGHGIIIPERRAAGVTAGAIRASAGALEHVRVARVNNVAKSAEYLKTIGLNLIGLDQDAPGPLCRTRLHGAHSDRGRFGRTRHCSRSKVGLPFTHLHPAARKTWHPSMPPWRRPSSYTRRFGNGRQSATRLRMRILVIPNNGSLRNRLCDVIGEWSS